MSLGGPWGGAEQSALKRVVGAVLQLTYQTIFPQNIGSPC